MTWAFADKDTLYSELEMEDGFQCGLASEDVVSFHIWFNNSKFPKPNYPVPATVALTDLYYRAYWRCRDAGEYRNQYE